MVDAHLLTQILISIPGVGITTVSTILFTASALSSFPHQATWRLTLTSHRPHVAREDPFPWNSRSALAPSTSRMRCSDPRGAFLSRSEIENLLRPQTPRRQET